MKKLLIISLSLLPMTAVAQGEQAVRKKFTQVQKDSTIINMNREIPEFMVVKIEERLLLSYPALKSVEILHDDQLVKLVYAANIDEGELSEIINHF